MSAGLAPIDGRSRTLCGVLVACGVLALLLRTAVVGHGGARTVYALMMVTIAVISLAAPAGRSATSRPRTTIVTSAGVAVVVLVAFLLGDGVPLPHDGVVLALGTCAAIAEELFFRRLVYGTLVPWRPAVAIVGSAVLFALIHVPLYGAPAIWVDLGAGLLFSWQRWASDDWHASAATHVVTNILAVLR